MRKIPFLSFEKMHSEIREEMVETFKTVYDSYWYVNGQSVQKFESEYAKFNNTSYCIGVSNGLDALYLILKALGIKPGDEIIVPSNTYIATALAVSYLEAKLVFVEPSIETYNIDVTKIEEAITSKTKAIMPVHLYGQACEMDKIMEIAQKHSIYVVEDNAQSQGAMFKGQLTGSWGIANGTSFYPGKNLGALGDAGAITTNDHNLAKNIQTLKNYGSQKKYYNEVIGHNMRLDELQAAFLSKKLTHLTSWNQQRQEIASIYNRELANLNQIILPSVHTSATHMYHQYIIRTQRRDELMKFLEDAGISTMIHYPVPPYLQKAYVHLNIPKGTFPIADELAETMISLPIWPGLKDDDVRYICQQIKTFFNV